MSKCLQADSTHGPMVCCLWPLPTFLLLSKGMCGPDLAFQDLQFCPQELGAVWFMRLQERMELSYRTAREVELKRSLWVPSGRQHFLQQKPRSLWLPPNHLSRDLQGYGAKNILGSETEIKDSSELEDERWNRNGRTGDEGRKETVSLDRRRRKLEYRQVG